MKFFISLAIDLILLLVALVAVIIYDENFWIVIFAAAMYVNGHFTQRKWHEHRT